MTAIAHARRLSPPRTFDHKAINQTFEELNAIIRELQVQVAEARGVGVAPEVVTLGRHLDVQGNRLQNVGPTRAETDVPNVRELRNHALYARDGIHETDRLILAKGGVRTVTPAVAPNDLITLGEVQRLVAQAGFGTTSSNASGSTVTTPDAGWAYPQANVTVTNGLTSDWTVPASVYLRITGPTAAFSLGGFQSVSDGRLLILQNATVQDLTLVDEDLATTATHRIQTGTGGDLVMSGLGTTQLLYSLADLRWIVL